MTFPPSTRSLHRFQNVNGRLLVFGEGSAVNGTDPDDPTLQNSAVSQMSASTEKNTQAFDKAENQKEMWWSSH